MDTEPWWQYRARPDDREYGMGVVDGDTLALVIDQGFGDHTHDRVRLSGVDTAEIYGVEKESDEYVLGQKQAEFVYEWLARACEEHDGDWPLAIQTEYDQTGKYGRIIAAVTRRCDRDVLAATIAERWPETATDQ